MRGSAGPRVFVTEPFCRGFTTSDKFFFLSLMTPFFRAGRGNVASLDSQTIARKGSSMPRFWPSKCAFSYSFIFEGARAPPLISTEGDGSPRPAVSRLVIHSDYIWQSLFSSGGAGGGSKASRRALPSLPSDLGKTPLPYPDSP